jgi:hypothetical protein
MRLKRAFSLLFKICADVFKHKKMPKRAKIMVKQKKDYLSFKKLDCRMPDCFENINKSVGFPKLWTMRKSRYEDAQGE